MSISASFTRLIEYQRRHGFRVTLRRAGVAARRAILARNMVVFYCDLGKLRPILAPAGCCVRRVGSLAELGSDRLQEVISFWNAKLAERNIRERFAKGATLWLVEAENQLAGFGWTLEGNTIEPYYFPLGARDVQLFDFYIFPKFRGLTFYWLLTNRILETLAVEGCSRAFADTGEWNRAQLAAFKVTPFRALGSVKTYKLFGRRLTTWSAGGSAGQIRQMVGRSPKTMSEPRLNG
jgi:hypothetical protein